MGFDGDEGAPHVEQRPTGARHLDVRTQTLSTVVGGLPTGLFKSALFCPFNAHMAIDGHGSHGVNKLVFVCGCVCVCVSLCLGVLVHLCLCVSL